MVHVLLTLAAFDIVIMHIHFGVSSQIDLIPIILYMYKILFLNAVCICFNYIFWCFLDIFPEVISSKLSCDFRLLTTIFNDFKVISDVFVKVSLAKKTLWKRYNWSWVPVRMEFTLMSLYSTEITRYRSWFLAYKLTQVNSVLHGHTCAMIIHTLTLLHVCLQDGSGTANNLKTRTCWLFE